MIGINIYDILISIILISFIFYIAINYFKTAYYKDIKETENKYYDVYGNIISFFYKYLQSITNSYYSITESNYSGPINYIDRINKTALSIHAGTEKYSKILIDILDGIEIIKKQNISIYGTVNDLARNEIKESVKIIEHYSTRLRFMTNSVSSLSDNIKSINTKILQSRVFKSPQLIDNLTGTSTPLNQFTNDLKNICKTMLKSLDTIIDLEISKMCSDIILVNGHIYDTFYNYTRNVYNITSDYVDNISKSIKNVINISREYIIRVDYMQKMQGLKLLHKIKDYEVIILANVVNKSNHVVFHMVPDVNYNYYIAKINGEYIPFPIRKIFHNKGYINEISLIYEIKGVSDHSIKINKHAICEQMSNFEYLLINKGEAFI